MLPLFVKSLYMVIFFEAKSNEPPGLIIILPKDLSESKIGELVVDGIVTESLEVGIKLEDQLEAVPQSEFVFPVQVD
jgi:hypothetical protein